MEELLVISGALFILVLSIVGMKIYRRRTDVLTGPYISNTDHRLIIPDKRTHRFDPATAERTRTRRPFQRGWNSDSRPPDARKGATGYSSSWGADHSKSVRRSDALTVVDRLEGWCRHQTARLAELKESDPTSGGETIEGHNNLALHQRGEPTAQMTGREGVSSHANYSDVPAVKVSDQGLTAADGIRDDTGGEITNADQSRAAIERLEHPANAPGHTDRRMADLTNHIAETPPPALTAAVDGEMGPMIAHLAASDTAGRSSPEANNTKAESTDDDVLDEIAKALGTIA